MNFNRVGGVSLLALLITLIAQNAFAQAELILRAALDSTVASESRTESFVQCIDHFGLLQSNGMDPPRCTPNLVWSTIGG